MIETPAEVERVLQHPRVPLCLDSGHLTVGGSDPVELARTVPHRIAHVHVKDVDAQLAADVRSGRVSYTDAVRDGMYTRLGEGDIDLREIVRSLETAGYAGWMSPSSTGCCPLRQPTVARWWTCAPASRRCAAWCDADAPCLRPRSRARDRSEVERFGSCA